MEDAFKPVQYKFPESHAVYLTNGERLDLVALVHYHNNRSPRRDLNESESAKWLLHPFKHTQLSDEDVARVVNVATHHLPPLRIHNLLRIQGIHLHQLQIEQPLDIQAVMNSGMEIVGPENFRGALPRFPILLTFYSSLFAGSPYASLFEVSAILSPATNFLVGTASNIAMFEMIDTVAGTNWLGLTSVPTILLGSSTYIGQRFLNYSLNNLPQISSGRDENTEESNHDPLFLLWNFIGQLPERLRSLAISLYFIAQSCLNNSRQQITEQNASPEITRPTLNGNWAPFFRSHVEILDDEEESPGRTSLPRPGNRPSIDDID